jgi:hypothetical protein
MIKYIMLIMSLTFLGCAKTNEAPFSVNVQLVKSNGNQYTYSCRVRNVSIKSHDVSIFYCSYDENWVSSNPGVVIERRDCNKNFITGKNLKPLQSFEHLITVTVNSPKAVEFRLGFSPFKPGGFDHLGPYWSNEVEIKS